MECSGEASFTSLDADTTAAVNVTAAVFTGVFSLLLHTTALYDSCLNPAEDPAVLWLEEHAPEEIRHRRAREAQRQIERERRSSADHCASTVSECRGTDCLLSLGGSSSGFHSQSAKKAHFSLCRGSVQWHCLLLAADLMSSDGQAKPAKRSPRPVSE